MTRRRGLIAVFAALVVATISGFYGLTAKFRIEAKNGPESTIGRSGDLKSPGGITDAERRRS
jgi:hypothetical protein